MIDEIYNSRIGAIKVSHFSDEWEQTAISFEESLTEEQAIMFHKLCKVQQIVSHHTSFVNSHYG